MMKPADCQQRPGTYYRCNGLPTPTLPLAVAALALLLTACSGTPPRPQRPKPSTPRTDARPVDPAKANAVLMRAIGLVGTPYRYGGNTPEGGFDCSGLVGYVYRDMLDPVSYTHLDVYKRQVCNNALRTRFQRQQGALFNDAAAAFAHYPRQFRNVTVGAQCGIAPKT